MISPGVDTERFKPHSEEGPLSVAFVGRLADHKGVLTLVESFQEVWAEMPSVRLVLIGEGPLGDTLRAVAATEARLVLKGEVARHAVAEELSAAALFALPAQDTTRLGRLIGAEQYGFSLVEALSAGLPVVTTSCGAIRDVVPKWNTFVPQRDPHSLAQGILQLLRAPEHRRRLGQLNREYAVAELSQSLQARKLEALLEAVWKA